MIFRRTLLLAISLALACWWWLGGKRPVEAEKAVDGGKVAVSGKFTPDAAAATKGPASADELQIGSVRLNKRKRTISFPAKVAEKERALEYVIVHETGKTHEALLSTSAAIHDVHVAALLLDAGGLSPQIEVTWRKHGGDARVPLHAMIGMKGGSLDAVWHYNGSEFIHGGFAASREGSVVALMNDPSALVNHPAAGALMKDDVFFAQRAQLPPEGVQVIVVMTFTNP